MIVRVLVVALFIAASAFGAFTATVQWDVRSTGNDANGGGFDSVAGTPGTDYSQQNAPQIAYTDLVIGGTTTTFTSATNPVTAAIVGNIINVVSGAGCTVQRVQVISQAAGVATVDKSLGTTASTCAGNLGGALATPEAAYALLVGGHTIWVKGVATYTISAALACAVSACSIRGYETVHGDRTGNRPTITSTTDSVNLLTRSNSSNTLLYVDNLILIHAAATRGNAVSSQTTGTETIMVLGTLIDGAADGVGGIQTIDNLIVQNAEIKNCTGQGIEGNYTNALVQDSYIHDNTGAGIATTSSSILNLMGTIVSTNGGGGITLNNVNTTLNLLGNTIANNTGAGVSSGQTPAMKLIGKGNLFWGNSTYGVSFAGGSYLQSYPVTFMNNAFGGNGTSDHNNFTTGVSPVAVLVDPFVNATGGNFALNSAATGGALLKGAGLPGLFPGGTVTGYRDIGAVQSQGVAPATRSWGAVQ